MSNLVAGKCDEDKVINVITNQLRGSSSYTCLVYLKKHLFCKLKE